MFQRQKLSWHATHCMFGLLALLWPRHGSAQLTLAVNWHIDASAQACVTSRALTWLLESKLGGQVLSSSNADRIVEGLVQRQRDTFVARIYISDQHGQGAELAELRVPQCHGLDEALTDAVIAVIDQQRTHVAMAGTQPNGPAPSSPDAHTGGASQRPKAGEPQHTSIVQARRRRLSRDGAANYVSPFLLGARAGLGGGWLGGFSRWLPSFVSELGLSNGGWSYYFTFSYVTGRAASVYDYHADLRAYHLTLSACVQMLTLARVRLDAWLCFGLSAMQVAQRSSAFKRFDTDEGWTGDVAVGARMNYRPYPWLALLIHVQTDVPNYTGEIHPSSPRNEPQSVLVTPQIGAEVHF